MRSLLVLAAVALLVASTIAAAPKKFVRSPISIVESPRTQLLRLGNWTQLAQLRAKQLASSQLYGRYGGFHSVQDGITVNISLASPSQSLRVLLDLTSPLSWVTSRDCSPANCPGWCAANRFCEKVCLPQCCGSAATTGAPANTDAPTDSPVPGETNAPTDAPAPEPTDATTSAPILSRASRLIGTVFGVNDTQPAPNACHAKHSYNQSQSWTHHNDGRPFVAEVPVRSDSQQEAATTKIFGYLERDNYQFGRNQFGYGVSVSAATFGVASQITEDTFHNGAFDGVLGLGGGRTADGDESILQQAVSQYSIDEPSLTIWIAKPNSCGVEGVLTYGSTDQDNCDYFGTDVNADVTDLSFGLSGYTLNGGEQSAVNLTAKIDFNTAELVASQSIIDEIVKAADASYDEKYDAYFVDCNQKINVEFALANVDEERSSFTTITVSEKDLIARPAPTVCTLSVGANADAGDTVTLGRAVISSYCVHIHLDDSPSLSLYKVSSHH